MGRLVRQTGRNLRGKRCREMCSETKDLRDKRGPWLLLAFVFITFVLHPHASPHTPSPGPLALKITSVAHRPSSPSQFQSNSQQPCDSTSTSPSTHPFQSMYVCTSLTNFYLFSVAFGFLLHGRQLRNLHLLRHEARTTSGIARPKLSDEPNSKNPNLPSEVEFRRNNSSANVWRNSKTFKSKPFNRLVSFSTEGEFFHACHD